MAILLVYQTQMLTDMHEGGTDPGLFNELRAATDLALRATKVAVRSLGQVMLTILWLNLSDVQDVRWFHLLDTPISQVGLFGGAVEGSA